MFIAFNLLCSLASAAPGWEPSNSQVGVFNAGVTAYNEGRFSAAIAMFQKVVKAEPECTLCVFMLGASQAGAGETEAAVESLTAASRAFPGREEIEVQLGNALFLLQRFVEASAVARRALTAVPGSQPALMNAIRADVRLGRTDAALAMLDGLTHEQDPGTLACQRILVLESAHRDDEARALLHACKTSPVPAEIAEAEARLGGLEGAEAAALAMGAGNVSRSLRAVALFNLGQIPAAEALFREVLVENPDDALARANRATCLYRLGRESEARKEVQRLFAAGSWVRRENNGAISGILTARNAEDLEGALRTALAGLVMELKDGDLVSAQDAQLRAEQRFGRTGPLVTSAAALEFAGGSWGWNTLLPVLAEALPEDIVWDLVGDQSFVHPEAVPPAVAAWIVKRGSDTSRYNLAAGRSNLKDYAGCLEAVAPIPEPSTEQAVNLGYSCAIQAGDDTTVSAWRERAKHAGTLTFRNACNDAERAARAGDWSGVMQRLNLAVPAGAEEVGLSNDLTVQALRGLGRLDEAIKWSYEPGVDAGTVYNVGVALHQAGRMEEATAMAKRACVGASGELHELCV